MSNSSSILSNKFNYFILFTPIVCFIYYFQRHYSLSFFAVGLSLICLFYFLYLKWDKIERRWVAITVFSLAALGLPALGLWQFLQLQDPGDHDHASYACSLWNMAHGSTQYSLDDMNFFGTHSDYTGLLWIPVQYVTGEFGLKFGKCLCLLLASILAVRRHWANKEIACLGATAILLSPPIASQFFNGFHLEFLAAPILVLALDAYRDNRFVYFLGYTAFLAYSKEVFTLAIAGILIIALIERRHWKWIVFPGFLCCVQMGLYWFVIMPHFAPKGNKLNSFFPSSPMQIFQDWCRPQTLYYAFQLIFPFLPLMLSLPKRYFLLPVPLFIFYAAFPDPLFQTMSSHYPFPLAFLCFSGFILFGKLAIQNKQKTETSSSNVIAPPKVSGKILIASIVISMLSYPSWRCVFSIPLPNFARIHDVKQIHSMIPDNASLLIHAPFTSLFVSRKTASDWTYRKRPSEEFDYVVFDRLFTPEFHVKKEQLELDFEYLKASPGWSIAFSKDELYLFRNNRSHLYP